ncbi:hypothetical protein SB748_28655 [Rhizobium sp. SIMBA_035]
MFDNYAGNLANDGVNHSRISVDKLGSAEHTKAFAHFEQGGVCSNAAAQWW